MALKARAIRVFGSVSLVAGVVYGALTLFVMSPVRAMRPWETGAPLFLRLLSILAAGNLIYIGWHALSRGTVPVRPGSLFHWRDVLRYRTGLWSMNRALTSGSVAILFSGLGWLAAKAVISYAAAIPPWKTPSLSGWVLEFPLALAAAMLLGRVLGCLRRPGVGRIAGATAVILLGNIAAWGIFLSLAVFWFLMISWLVGLILALLANAFFLAIAHVILHDDPTKSLDASICFFGRMLWAGFPIGLLLGGFLAHVSGTSEWVVLSIQITWGTMLGLSLVPAKLVSAQLLATTPHKA